MGLEVGQPTITESKVQVAVYVQCQIIAQTIWIFDKITDLSICYIAEAR